MKKKIDKKYEMNNKRKFILFCLHTVLIKILLLQLLYPLLRRFLNKKEFDLSFWLLLILILLFFSSDVAYTVTLDSKKARDKIQPNIVIISAMLVLWNFVHPVLSYR